MQTENLVLYYCSHGYVIEQSGEHGPYCLAAELFMALLVKAIDLSDSARFVVSACEVYAIWVSDFECD